MQGSSVSTTLPNNPERGEVVSLLTKRETGEREWTRREREKESR